MTNYHHHPTANPLDGIIIAMMPSGAPTTEPPSAQLIPKEQPGMHQFLWIWDHRAGMDAIIGIGQSGRNRMLPGAQTWQRSPTAPPPVRSGWLATIKQLIWGD